ncbi:hypothetical protein J6590_102355 [Homalodisca vitripennis]|nr:hypothetical protein J6590_102355 [Homalodisca vitripennis]
MPVAKATNSKNFDIVIKSLRRREVSCQVAALPPKHVPSNSTNPNCENGPGSQSDLTSPKPLKRRSDRKPNKTHISSEPKRKTRASAVCSEIFPEDEAFLQINEVPKKRSYQRKMSAVAWYVRTSGALLRLQMSAVAWYLRTSGALLRLQMSAVAWYLRTSGALLRLQMSAVAWYLRTSGALLRLQMSAVMVPTHIWSLVTIADACCSMMSAVAWYLRTSGSLLRLQTSAVMVPTHIWSLVTIADVCCHGTYAHLEPCYDCRCLLSWYLRTSGALLRLQMPAVAWYLRTYGALLRLQMPAVMSLQVPDTKIPKTSKAEEPECLWVDDNANAPPTPLTTPNKRSYSRKVPAVPNNTPVVFFPACEREPASPSHHPLHQTVETKTARSECASLADDASTCTASTMSWDSGSSSAVRTPRRGRGRRCLWLPDSSEEDEEEVEVSEYELLRRKNVEENLKMLR